MKVCFPPKEKFLDGTQKWVLKWQILVTEKLLKNITTIGYEIKKILKPKIS